MNNSALHPAAPKPANPQSFSFLEMRTKILGVFLWVTAGIGLLVTASFWGNLTLIVIGAGAVLFLLLLTAAFVPLPYPVRAWMLLASLFGFGIIEVLQTSAINGSWLILLVFVVLAAILFERKEFFIALGIAAAAMAVMGWLVATGILASAGLPGAANKMVSWVIGILVMVLAAFGLEEGWRRLGQEYFVTQATLKNAMSTLSNERVNFETRITERIKETTAITDTQRTRADLFRDINEIMQSMDPSQEPDELMAAVAKQIGEKFHLYHVGIYLNDENNAYTVLKAAYGAGAERLLAKGLIRKIDQSGIVNYVAASGLPRVTRRAKDDILHDTNPDLPEARSIMALPLQKGQKVIGVLDLESSQEGGIPEQNLEALSMLASQMTMAIDLSRILSETRRALSEARVVYGHYMRQAWEQLAVEKRAVGYRFAASKVDPLENPLDLPEVQTALDTGQPITSSEDKPAVTIPLKLRDEVIGVLDIRSSNPGRVWNENEMALIQAIAERVSLALENARLFEETTRRADRERTVSEITTHIRSTTDPQAMLKTALEELKRALGAKDIRLHPYTPPSPERSGQ